ncbi:MAG: hypothetical protein E6X17_06150 [Sporomusaceae bacterium]|nr:hypothetical protein [Sporomusaceae bacterium]
MRDRHKPWLTGIAALVATMLLLFAGQAIWYTFAVAKPLDTAFAELDGVQAVVRLEKDPVVLQVTLARAANIQATYTGLEEQAKEILGKAPFELRIEDNRTPELTRLYQELQFPIQEAIATGRFGDLPGRIRQSCDAAAVTGAVYVDARYVYLQLAKEGAELYSVIPRMNAEVR